MTLTSRRARACCDGAVSACCGHADDQHRLTNMCQDVIHYPSEDYPCLCVGFESGDGGVCGNCKHRRESHAFARVCKVPGEYCGCSRVVQEMKSRAAALPPHS